MLIFRLPSPTSLDVKQENLWAGMGERSARTTTTRDMLQHHKLYRVFCTFLDETMIDNSLIYHYIIILNV